MSSKTKKTYKSKRQSSTSKSNVKGALVEAAEVPLYLKTLFDTKHCKFRGPHAILNGMGSAGPIGKNFPLSKLVEHNPLV